MSELTPSDMVKEFHYAFGHPVRNEPTAHIPEIGLRIKLLREEVQEYVAGASAGDIVNIAQELADIIYVTYGAALVHGIDLDPVIAEVHRANMSKLDEDGKPVLRDDGKVLKSNLFKKADVESIIAAQSANS